MRGLFPREAGPQMIPALAPATRCTNAAPAPHCERAHRAMRWFRPRPALSLSLLTAASSHASVRRQVLSSSRCSPGHQSIARALILTATHQINAWAWIRAGAYQASILPAHHRPGQQPDTRKQPFHPCPSCPPPAPCKLGRAPLGLRLQSPASCAVAGVCFRHSPALASCVGQAGCAHSTMSGQVTTGNDHKRGENDGDGKVEEEGSREASSRAHALRFRVLKEDGAARLGLVELPRIRVTNPEQEPAGAVAGTQPAQAGSTQAQDGTPAESPRPGCEVLRFETPMVVPYTRRGLLLHLTPDVMRGLDVPALQLSTLHL